MNSLNLFFIFMKTYSFLSISTKHYCQHIKHLQFFRFLNLIHFNSISFFGISFFISTKTLDFVILKYSHYTQNFSSVEDNLAYSFPLSFMYTSTIMDVSFPISLISKSQNRMLLYSSFFINYLVYLFILKETHPYVCE